MTTKLDLVVESFGTSLHLRSERLVVEQKGHVLGQYALRQLGSVSVASKGVALSSDVLMALTEHNILFQVTDFAQRPLLNIASPMLTSRARVRCEQYAWANSARGLSLSKLLIASKIRAQRRLLVFTRRRSSTPNQVERVIERLGDFEAQVWAMAPGEADPRLSLMGLEGAAAAAYWPAVASTSSWVDGFKRIKRGATDPVNAALNYGYAVLHSRVWGMCDRAGLDPFVGFLHGVESGRLNLVLDLMEPWRTVVDDAVFSLMRRRRSPLPETLDQELRRAVVAEVSQRLMARSEYDGRAAVVLSCMQRSLRQLVKVLDGEEPQWRVYRWDVRGPRVPEDDDAEVLLDEVRVGKPR